MSDNPMHCGHRPPVWQRKAGRSRLDDPARRGDRVGRCRAEETRGRERVMMDEQEYEHAEMLACAEARGDTFRLSRWC